MTKTLIFLLNCSILIIGCNTQKKEMQLIYKKGAITKLEQIIEKTKNGNEIITPNVALESIIEIYNSKNRAIQTNENPITLYVVYDTDYWTEYRESETFEITFAHQVVEESNGPPYEYRITMIYDKEPFEGINKFDKRFPRDNEDIKSYKETISKSIGFKIASKMNVKQIEIIKEEI